MTECYSWKIVQMFTSPIALSIQTWATLGWFMVNVPVLSHKIIEVAPILSTASRFFTTQFLFCKGQHLSETCIFLIFEPKFADKMHIPQSAKYEFSHTFHYGQY